MRGGEGERKRGERGEKRREEQTYKQINGWPRKRSKKGDKSAEEAEGRKRKREEGGERDRRRLQARKSISRPKLRNYNSTSGARAKQAATGRFLQRGWCWRQMASGTSTYRPPSTVVWLASLHDAHRRGQGEKSYYNIWSSSGFPRLP